MYDAGGQRHHHGDQAGISLHSRGLGCCAGDWSGTFVAHDVKLRRNRGSRQRLIFESACVILDIRQARLTGRLQEGREVWLATAF
jgi:hypothetical protein